MNGEIFKNSFSPDSSCVDRTRASPNHGERRGYERPDSVILHYTGMPSAEKALERLCEPMAEVSAHYLVFEDGAIIQLGPEARRAWHAGRSFWRGATDMNSASIGIEIAHPGHLADPLDHMDIWRAEAQNSRSPSSYAKAQIKAVARLLADILKRHAIDPARVLAHSDIAPDRKSDPGEFFPWDVLEAAGLARPTPQLPRIKSGEAPAHGCGLTLAFGAHGALVRRAQRDLAALGYQAPSSGIYDAWTRLTVRAFQRRFRRARADGVLDPETRAVLTLLQDC